GSLVGGRRFKVQRGSLDICVRERRGRRGKSLPATPGWSLFPNIVSAPKCPTQRPQSFAGGSVRVGEDRRDFSGSLSRQGGRTQRQVSDRRQSDQSGGVRRPRPKLRPVGSPRRKSSAGGQAKSLGAFRE